MSEAVDAFDRTAHGYDAWYISEKGRQVLSAETGLIERLLPSSGVGLEIGAGTGVFAEALTAGGRCVVCLDLSREMLLRAYGRGLPSVLASADSMPFRDGALDFAYMVTVLEFLEDPIASLREAACVTNGEAPVVVLFINRDSPWGRLYATMAEKGDPIFSHAKLYTLEEVGEIVLEAGLDLVEAAGTLTTAPEAQDAGDEIMKPGTETGVVAVKLLKKSA